MKQEFSCFKLRLLAMAHTPLLRLSVACLLTCLHLGQTWAANTLSLIDAVRRTLAQNSEIQLQQKQVEFSVGVLQQNKGQFDTTFNVEAKRTIDHSPLNQQDINAYSSANFPVSQLKTATTSYTVALNTPLRNGIVLTPSISLASTTGTLNDFNHLLAQNRGNVNFNIRVPLLKGSGDSASGGEVAANQEWEASKQNLRFSISQSVLNTVTSYWGLLASRKNLDIAAESEAGVRRMVDETRRVIAADELPAADLNLLKANLLEKSAARMSAEQAVLEAQQKLGLAIGLNFAQITTLDIADGFPDIAAEDDVQKIRRPRLIDMAMTRRPDIKAAKYHQDAARTLTRAAANELKPQLDIVFNMGYAGLSEGGAPIAGINQHRGGANIGASVSYQWPIANNSARGRFQQQSATYDQSSIQLASIERSIETGVDAAISSLSHSALQLRHSEDTVELYRVSVDNEKTKYKLGSSTMIDVLAINDRLLGARLGNIAYRLNYLNALATLNFQTGALLAEKDAGLTVTFAQFTSFPGLD